MEIKNYNKKKIENDVIFSHELYSEILRKLDKLYISNRLQILNNINHCLYEQHLTEQSLFNLNPSDLNDEYNISFESEATNPCIKF